MSKLNIDILPIPDNLSIQNVVLLTFEIKTLMNLFQSEIQRFLFWVSKVYFEIETITK